MKPKLFLFLILTLFVSIFSWSSNGKNVSGKIRKKIIDEINLKKANDFYALLGNDRKIFLQNLIKKINKSKPPTRKHPERGLIKIDEVKSNRQDQGKPILLFTQGLPMKEGREIFKAWYPVFDKFTHAGYHVYFQKFNIKKTVGINSKALLFTLSHLKNIYRNKKIIIFSYSAGGRVGLDSWYRIFYSPRYKSLKKNIELVTIATPINGYGAPQLSLMGIPFMGAFLMQTGMGMSKKRKKANYKKCHHYITTSCDLDIHACEHNGLYPQVSWNHMPCGLSNTVALKRETHHSVIFAAVKNYLQKIKFREKR